MQARRQQAFNLAREAAEWLGRLEEDGTADNPEFAEWLAASPLHVKAFLNVSAVEGLLGRIDPLKRIDIERLVGEMPAHVSKLQPLTLPSPQRGEGKKRWWWRPAIAAAVAIVAVGAIWGLRLVNPNTWSTAIGEQRTVELSDGSVVNLNTRSEIRTRFSENAREVFLEGEAMFKVHRDPARPFRVHSGDAVIQAVGTQFNVHQLPSGTIVSVIEGLVQVSRHSQPKPLELAAGEEARVARKGRLEKRPLSGTANIAIWRQHRLIFSDDRLEDIAAEFNRWNHEQIRVEGETVAARLYSGSFDADDSESFVAFLKRDPGLIFESANGELVVRAPVSR